MTKRDTPLDKVMRLERRRDYLHSRIVSNKTVDLSYDKAEMSALNWAIPILMAYLSRKETTDGDSAF